MLRIIYLLLILVCIFPTVPGTVGVLLSSLSYVPPIGMTSISLEGFIAVFEWSAVWKSIALTIFTTLFSCLLCCFLAFSIIQSTWRYRRWRIVERALSPLLAMPHVAFAIGFAFLFSPTGIISRLINPVIDVSSIALLVKDQYGLGLSFALALKELPFLLLMSVPILNQLKIDQLAKVTTSLGYSPNQFWWKCVFPQWLTKIRFPLIAIVAYSASVVDISLILGPTNPPTFSVLVWQWFSNPDLHLFPRAGAGAVLLFFICSLLFLLVRTFEWFCVSKRKQWQYSGRYGFSVPGQRFFIMLMLINLTILPLTIVWSFAQRWRFPDLIPSKFSRQFWALEWESILPTINNSLLLALISSGVALLFALVAHEYQNKYRLHIPHFIIALPILVPQLSLLFGIQVATLYINFNSYFIWVVWSHVFFAFPYVFLALDGPWKSYEEGYTRTALSLGKSPLYTWLKIKAPILLPAILFSWAIGASVSLAQYLPTLMLGAGRISTITTEAVALSSGFDRRVTAIYAIWQAALPFLFFTFAYMTSRIQSRVINKRRRKIIDHEPFSKKTHHL